MRIRFFALILCTAMLLCAYGFDPNFSAYYLDGDEELIKNTAVFEIMLALLEN